MSGRTIPTFPGFKLTQKERYLYAQEGRLFRLGIKMNTPNMCNWSCPYCYVGNSSAKDRPRLLESDELTNVGLQKDPDWVNRMQGWIEQGIELGVRAITFNGTFEPTTSGDLLSIINFCRDRDLFVTLVTNGGNLDEVKLRDFYDLQINILTKINIPLIEEGDPRYAEFCQIQKEMSGVNKEASQVYERQKHIIRMMMDIGFNQTPVAGQTRMGVESVITTRNLAYLPELVWQLREWNIYSHIEVTKNQGFAKNNSHLIPDGKDIHQLFEDILANDLQMGFAGWEPRPPYVAGACHENLFRLDVHANGKVKPCPGIETTVGDLNFEPMKNIIEKGSLAVIRNLEDNIQGDCKNCELFISRECFAGCRGTAYQTMIAAGRSEQEAWVASDPSCWRVKKVLNDGTTVEDILPPPVYKTKVQITPRQHTV